MSEVFEQNENKLVREKLHFEGIPGKDVYNITAPFQLGEKTYIAGRVESPDTTTDAHTVFFIKNGDVWKADFTLPQFPLEDPFIKEIRDEIIFGGVETYSLPDVHEVGYRTVFYKGKDLMSLERFAAGPDMMKDIRLVAMFNGKIGVFTRPQGTVGGKGTIGFTEINSLDELTPETISNAQLITEQFNENEWGGVNDAYLLRDGTLGVVGHIGREDTNGTKHYFVMSFAFNPTTFQASPLKIIATRETFPDGKAKNLKLKDVVFPGGYVDNTLYVGLSDAEAAYIKLPDIF